MRLTVTLVLVALAQTSLANYYYLPWTGNAHLISPYHYVVQHQIPQQVPVLQHHIPQHVPDVLQHPQASPGSRETLEDESNEGFLQHADNSDEQASLNPDEVQRPQRPHVPPSRPVGGHIPNIPAPSGGNRPGANDEVPNIIFNGPQQDGSYDFSYSLGDQSRSEKSDANGNVQGSYSYTGADGKQVTVTYTAGAGQGYIPEGEGLLPPPVHPAGGGEEGAWGPEEEQSHDVPQVPQRPVIPQIPQEDDSQQHIPPVVAKRPPVTKGHVPQEPEEPASHGGMPYSYNYDAGLSSKKETADDDGNVEGSYTYIDGAGVSRTVTYTVKGDEGFVATGDIHPDPGSPNENPTPNQGGQGSVPPPSWIAPQGGVKGVKGHPTPPPTKGHPPPRPIPTPPPTKGHRPPPPPTPRPPVKGVKGHNTPPPPAKGGNKGAGWDKYPLGK